MGSFRPFPATSAAANDIRGIHRLASHPPKAALPHDNPGFLALDHATIAVRDIVDLRTRFAALGFRMTPISFHRFGTSTTQAVFHNCMIEIAGVYDRTPSDEDSHGSYSPSRWMEDRIAERDGIVFLTLHSTAVDADAETLRARGIEVGERMEFGRYVIMPDFRADRTKTTAFAIHDNLWPRMSAFVCQQHKRSVLEARMWLRHPNTARCISQVVVMAPPHRQPAVAAKYARMYGAGAIIPHPAGFTVQTGAGTIDVLDREGVEFGYGPLPPALARETEPCCVAIHVQVESTHAVRPILNASGIAHDASCGRVVVRDAERFGNTFLVFDSLSRR